MRVVRYMSSKRKGRALMVPEGIDLETFLKAHPEFTEEFGGCPKGVITLLQSGIIGVDYKTAIQEINGKGFYVADHASIEMEIMD